MRQRRDPGAATRWLWALAPGVLAIGLLTGSISQLAGLPLAVPAVPAASATLWVWGWKSDGQLGDGTLGVAGPRQVAAGDSNLSLAQAGDGTVWARGTNFDGELGDGSTTTRTNPAPGLTPTLERTPTPVPPAARAWSWGNNSAGELGAGRAHAAS